MQLTLKNQTFNVSFEYEYKGVRIPIDTQFEQEDGVSFTSPYGGTYQAKIMKTEEDDRLMFTLRAKAPHPTQMRMRIDQEGEQGFHIIPCNIMGDNNARLVRPGEMPVLTNDHPEVEFCSPRWEFRADRAAMPIAGLCLATGAIAIAIDPYSTDGGQRIHNGLFAELPNAVGCSLGYRNDPCTFTNKRIPSPSTAEYVTDSMLNGSIYVIETAADPAAPKDDHRAIHAVIRREYEKRRELPTYQKTYREAALGLLTSFVKVNWNAKDGEYTNVNCKPPKKSEMTPWRNVMEIGWTGGGVLSYPLILTRDVLGEEADALLKEAMSGEEMTDRITGCYHPQSGLYLDLMSELNGSRVNGWWTGFGLVKDCHCAYTNGSALHYILKTIVYLKSKGRTYPENWLSTALQVCDTVMQLQRADGAFGYTYAVDHKEVLDWDGFAGCWFAPALAYAYQMTGTAAYLEAAKKALRYYHGEVAALTCSGTPMDTWKAVDEEGNLAFIRGCRIVHELTGEQEFLDKLEDGANYEFLWRYGYRTYPDFAPLSKESGNWNACGGSVT
ncbi:MAG: hypothetical protein K6G23_05725, partial [Lachnospiraceae bacterium]|nr:hypothetical protein [Lachnospiraceae bacterium]